MKGAMNPRVKMDAINNVSRITNFTNVTLDSTDPPPTYTPFLRPYVGFAGVLIIVVNSILLAFFNNHKRAVWTTFFFLTNLAISDIMMGFSLIMEVTNRLLLPLDIQWIVCRVLSGPAATLSGLMSGWCILLLSTQVQCNLGHYNLILFRIPGPVGFWAISIEIKNTRGPIFSNHLQPCDLNVYQGYHKIFTIKFHDFPMTKSHKFFT